MPAIMLSRVDLPQPEGPMKETNSPSSMRRSTGASAVVARAPDWKVLPMLLISIMGLV